MGASGSGKTSFLNVLASRLALSPGSVLSGDVKVNGRLITSASFGKIGAFVQQDDILISSMTPRECIFFAAQLRTSLFGEELTERVEEMINRLGLWGCQHTKIGSNIVKGLSGGERKRTSIGYELITEPQLLLLDEPTSGLDSLSTLKLCKMLRKEALRGRTIMATIHSPSLEAFMVFNRLLLLHDGNQIYQGPTTEVTQYLQSMSIQPSKYTNIADFIIRMTQAPQLVRFNLTSQELVDQYDQKIRDKIQAQKDIVVRKYEGFHANFTEIQNQREVSVMRQFVAIFIRNFFFLARNPRVVQSAIINSTYLSIVFGACFFMSGDVSRFDSEQKAYSSWMGIATLICNNSFYYGIFVSILQMPTWVPVMKRELMNRMYSTSTYYWGRVTSCIIFQLVYPVLISSITFWFIGIDLTFWNFLMFVLNAVGVCLSGCSIGFLFGNTFDNDILCLQSAQMLNFYMFLLAGGWTNLNDLDKFNHAMSYLSPCRYSVEINMRIISDNNVPNGGYYDDRDALLAHYGYTLGYPRCFSALYLIAVILLIIGWCIILFRNRKF